MSEPERQLDPVAALCKSRSAERAGRREARAAFLRRVDEENARASKARVIVRWVAPLAFAASVLMVVFFFWRTEQSITSSRAR